MMLTNDGRRDVHIPAVVTFKKDHIFAVVSQNFFPITKLILYLIYCIRKYLKLETVDDLYTSY